MPEPPAAVNSSAACRRRLSLTGRPQFSQTWIVVPVISRCCQTSSSSIIAIHPFVYELLIAVERDASFRLNDLVGGKHHTTATSPGATDGRLAAQLREMFIEAVAKTVKRIAQGRQAPFTFAR
jgi:hypothetical protein